MGDAATKIETAKGERFVRASTFIPSTINAEKRTIDVRFTTGHKGRRSTWLSTYNEELVVDEKSMRMDRLNSGAPLLDLHKSWDLRNVIGVVERAWVANGEGHATIRFDDSPEAEAVWRKVQNGILRNVSVGYHVHRYEDVSKPDDKIRTLRATDWEPVEISMVPIGFDPGAQVRSADVSEEPAYDMEIVTRGAAAVTAQGSEPSMKVESTQTPAAQTVDLEIEKKRAAEAAVAAERQRSADIVAICRQHKMEDTFSQDLVTRGVSVQEAKDAVLEALAKRSAAAPTVPGVRVEGGEDLEVNARAVGIESAILHRVDPAAFPLADQGRKFRYMSMVDIARTFVKGDTSEMSKLEIVSRALETRAGLHTTSDFPGILSNTVRKRLRQAYEAAPSTWQAWTRTVEVPDFKTNSVQQLGDAPSLATVNEGGEFTRGTVGEAKEEYALQTFGKVVSISRQALINDDLKAFDRLPMMFGRAAADKESAVVYAILTANANMDDGVALFHATHSNLGSAAVISVTTIGEARKKMRLQKGVNNELLLNLTPKFLIVPANLEATALQYLSSEMLASAPGSVNPYKGTLQLIVEPRLDAASTTAYYFAAEASQIDTVEVAYLQGHRGVYVETRQGFDVDGIDVKCRLDFAAKAIDWRGMVKNAGA